MDARELATRLINMGILAQRRQNLHMPAREKLHLHRRIEGGLEALLSGMESNPVFDTLIRDWSNDFEHNRPQAYAPFMYALLFKFIVTSETNIDWPTFEEVLEELGQSFAAEVVVINGGRR